MIVISTDGRLLRDLAAPLSQLGCSTLEKPFDLEDFLAQITRMLDARRQCACGGSPWPLLAS